MLRWDDIAMTTVQLDHLRQIFLLFWRGLCSSKGGRDVHSDCVQVAAKD